MPTSAFIKIMVKIIIVSVKSFTSLEMKAITAETAAAAIKSRVITSLNCKKKSLIIPALLPFSSAFSPWVLSLFSASALSSPPRVVFKASSV